MDIVFIEQLSVITTIGVYDWEQTIEQKLVFDIEMAWDNRKSARSDSASQTRDIRWRGEPICRPDKTLCVAIRRCVCARWRLRLTWPTAWCKKLLRIFLALLLEFRPDLRLLTTPQALDVVMVAQQNQARQHRDREGELGFKPPDVEWRNQRADDRAQ